MKAKIKTSILIITLLVGIISSQNATASNSTSVNASGSVPPPSVSGSPSGSPSGKPSGSGKGLRGESGQRPDGPRNLPPKNGGYSDKLSEITDEKIFKVKNVLRFLPLVEQDLLAGNLLFFLY